MALIELSGASFAYSGEIILETASAALHAGNCAGLVGPNGAGKTTLLRLLSGELDPDSGRVQRQRGMRVVYCTQAQAGHDAQTAWEFVLSRGDAMRRPVAEDGRGMASPLQADALEALAEREVDAKRVLTGIGLAQSHWDAPLGRLSGGQRQKAALARALITEAELYLFDEPANHLDLDAQDFLAARLRALASAYAGRALVLASHDRWLLDACSTHIWELEGGKLYSYPGNYSKSIVLRAARREQMAEQYERQQAEIARTEEYIRRNIAGQNTKQAQGRRTLLARMERVEAPKSDPSLRLVLTPASPSGDQVLHTEGLGFGFAETPGGTGAPPVNQVPEPHATGDGARATTVALPTGTTRLTLNPPVITAQAGATRPARLVLSGVSLALYRGEKLGITGNNGCGKTTLLRILARQYEPSAGVLAYGANVAPGFFAQDSGDLPGGTDALGAMRAVGALCSDGELRAYLARFGFSGGDVFKDCAALSGGERSRLSLARLFWQRPNLLLLDEPDNHLDIYAREALEQFLSAYEGTVVMVTHDRALLEGVCDRVLAFEPAVPSDVGAGPCPALATGQGMALPLQESAPAFSPVYFRGGYRDYIAYRDRPSMPVGAGLRPAQAAGRGVASPLRDAVPSPDEIAALAQQARMSVAAYRAKQAQRLRKRMADIEAMIEQTELQCSALREEQSERDQAGDYNALTRLQMELDQYQTLIGDLLDELIEAEASAESWEKEGAD